MSNMRTQWRITVAADTAAARTELSKLAKTAQAMGTSMEGMFSNVRGAPVARTFNNLGRELDRMNSAVMNGKTQLSSFNRYWRNSNNLIRHSKQLQHANYIALEKTNGAMSSATVTMRRFNQVTVSGAERLAYMNTWFRTSSRQALNFSKNLQWAGRQILVGFGVPFGLAMTGAAMAFLDFEEQLVRFRKVFNAEISDLSIEEAEERVTRLANTMATSLGVARDEVMETSALFAQMGYGVDEIERLTRATTELAMLGETDAQNAGKLLRAYSASGFVDTLAREGVNEQEFEDYIKNMLNMIENNTGLSIASMVESGMAQLIPLFSQMGVGAGIGESILAGMTEALGGRTSEAVTALKAIMQRVYDESAETTEQFGLIGIDIEALQDRYKSDFVGLVTELGDTLANNPAIQQNNKAVAETFGNLFGVRQANRAIAGLKAVSSAFDESGNAANDYGRALNAIQDPQEAAARAASELAAQADSVGGRLRRLKEAVMIAASDVGETVLEMIMPIVSAATDMIKWFTNLRESTKRFVIGLGGAVMVLAGTLTTVGVLNQAFIYFGRILSSLFPTLSLTNEAMTKQDIATKHLDEKLKHLRTTVSSLTPMYKSIAAAQRDARASTEGLTRAITEQNLAMSRGGARAGTMAGSGISTTGYAEGGAVYHQGAAGGRPFYAGGSATGAASASTPLYGGRTWQGRDRYYGPSGRITGGIGSGLGVPTATARHEALADAVISGPGANLGPNTSPSRFSKMQISARQRNRNMIASGPSALKWRRGAMLGGGMMTGAGLLMGGETGNQLMGAGMGVEMVSMLSSGKLGKRVAEMSNKLLDAGKNAKGFTRHMKTGLGSALSLATTMPAIGIAAAAVAAGAYGIKKAIDNAKKSANELRNEFAYASDIAEELGLEVENTFGGALAATSLDPDDFKEASDSMKSLIADVDRAMTRGGNEAVQRIFRNMARQWQEGGATIEEINEKLDELEANIGVVIEDVDTTELVRTVREDISGALQDSINSIYLEETIWSRLFSGGIAGGGIDSAFGEEGSARIANDAASIMRYITQAENASTNRVAAEWYEDLREDFVEAESKVLTEDLPQYYAELNRALGQVLGVSDYIAEDLEDTDALIQFYLSTRLDQLREMELTPEVQDEIERVEAIIDVYGEWEGQSNAVYESLHDIFNNPNLQRAGVVRQLANEVYQLAQAAGIDMNIIGPDGMANLERLQEIMQDSTQEELRIFIAGLRTMADTFEDGSVEAGILRRRIEELDAAYYAAGQRNYKRNPWAPEAPEIEMDDGPILEELESILNSEATDDALADAAEENVKSYVSNFRSALDKQRSEIISSILEAFDEISEQRLEGIEAEREAELESINERIEAIDEYIEKQKEIQEAMQDQIDLNVALASGNRGKAAQIQNAMRFGDIEDMAESAKDSLKESEDEIKSTYDDRIEAEKALREEQRKNIEDNAEDLEDMFLGSQDAWDEFYREATGLARDAGVSLEGELANGFVTAMDDVKRDMDLDEMWDNADFPSLERAIASSVEAGALAGMTAAEQHVVAQATQLLTKLEQTVDPDQQSLIESFINELADKSPGNRAIINRVRAGRTTGGSSGGVLPTFKHSGGPIGGGPPKDVPAVLQTGEYVIQRKAAQTLGEDVLSQMNNAHKFHTGGAVGLGMLSGMSSAMSLLNPMSSMLMGMNIANELGSLFSTIGGGSSLLTQAGQGMDSSQYGPRSWGKAAPNTLAAQRFIQENFSGVRGAYASVDRGNPKSDHSWGKALDVMTTSLGTYSDREEKEAGWQVANFFRDNANMFGTKYIIWQDMIANGSIGNWKWRDYGKADQGPTWGHFDHVHLSFLHDGGMAGQDGRLGLMKGGRLKANNVPATLHRGETVLRAPVAKNLEDGIRQLAVTPTSGGGVTVHVDNFHGTEDNIDRLAQKVGQVMERQQRKVNPTRRFG